jgi:hypothetical protein
MTRFDFTNTWDVLESGAEGAISYPFLRNNTQEPAPGLETVTPEFSVAITGATAPVVAGDTVAVTASVTNEGADGTRRINLTRFDGTTVDDRTLSLDASETTTVTLEWATAPGDDGSGTVTVTSATDADTTPVTVVATDLGIVSAVEAGGVVEVVTDSPLPRAAVTDLEVQLDGRVVYDGATLGNDTGADGALTAAAPPAFEDLVLESPSDRRHELEFRDGDDTPIDLDPNRNLTLTLTAGSGSGGPNTSVARESVLTGSVVDERDGNDAADNAKRIYAGADLAVRATDTDTELDLNTSGSALTTGANSRVIALDTAVFNTGEINEVTFDNDPTNVEFFTVRSLGYDVTANRTVVESGEPIEVDISANRVGAPYTARVLDTGGTVVATDTGTLDGANPTSIEFPTDATGAIDGANGPYTVTVTDNRTTVSASTDGITVEQPASSSLANLDIAGQGTDATVLPGASPGVAVTLANDGPDEASFEVSLTVTDGGNTTRITANRTETVAGGRDTTVSFASAVAGLPVDADPYTVALSTANDTISGSLSVHPDVNGNGEPARDTTGNGLLDDVTGSGEFGIADVVALFERFGDPPVANNPELFGFSSTDSVGIADVVALFRRV